MELIAVQKRLEDNHEFLANPLCSDSIRATVNHFEKEGYIPPWIGYYVKIDKDLVGAAAFKGPPIKGQVEIAYGTFEAYQQKGIGTKICKLLIQLALKTEPGVKITARTSPEKNFSGRILEKNGFAWKGNVIDPEDGVVWEWEYMK